MEPKLTRVSDNNNEEKSGELQLSPRTLLLNTFTVPLRRRDPGQRLLLILAIASFVIFEAVFPVDDTLLYLHFKVDILISILVGLADNVEQSCAQYRTSLISLKRILQISKLSGHYAWLLDSLF